MFLNLCLYNISISGRSGGNFTAQSIIFGKFETLQRNIFITSFTKCALHFNRLQIMERRKVVDLFLKNYLLYLIGKLEKGLLLCLYQSCFCSYFQGHFPLSSKLLSYFQIWVNQHTQQNNFKKKYLNKKLTNALSGNDSAIKLFKELDEFRSFCEILHKRLLWVGRVNKKALKISPFQC